MPVRRSAIAVVVALSVMMPPLVAGAAARGTDVVVAATGVAPDATSDNGQQKLARSPDGTLYLAYSEPNPDAPPPPGTKYPSQDDEGEAVFVARSDDGGGTWTTEARLSRDTVSARLAAIAAGPDGVVHAAWVDYETVGHVWYAVRRNGTWGPGEKVSPGPFYAGFPALAVGDDAVHLLWYGAPPDQETAHGSRYEIRHTIYSEGRWTEPGLVSTTSEDALNPTVVRDRDGVVHTAWYQSGVNAYRANYASWDGGWQIPRAVSPPEANATGVSMDVAPDGTVHLVWEQVGGDDLGVAHSRLRGGVWSEPELLAGRGAVDPVVASDDAGRVVAAWADGGEIEARVLEGEWGATSTLGPGAHPVLLSGESVLAAWTRPSSDGYEVVVASVDLGAAASGGILPVIIVTLAVGLVAAGVLLAWMRRREHAG